MLTLYQLKQNSCFRCVYKAPAYIKNLVLMAFLSIVLFCIYVIYFRTDGGSIKNAVNIIKGLHSNTFNYLQANSYEKLRIDRAPTTFYANVTQIKSMAFFSACVKFNKPCILR